MTFVDDLLGIAAKRLRDDYVGEISNWAFLGRDVMQAVLTVQRPTYQPLRRPFLDERQVAR